MSELSGKKIAVDISIYLYKFASDDTLIENIYLMLSIFSKEGVAMALRRKLTNTSSSGSAELQLALVEPPNAVHTLYPRKRPIEAII